jgi:hypothetical protein
MNFPQKSPQAKAWGYTDEARLRGLREKTDEFSAKKPPPSRVRVFWIFYGLEFPRTYAIYNRYQIRSSKVAFLFSPRRRALSV